MTGLIWRGKPVVDMTREELLEVLVQMADYHRTNMEHARNCITTLQQLLEAARDARRH